MPETINYDFDRIIDRSHTGALKTDALQQRFGRADLIPMWVADMDFACGDFIIDALKNRCDHGIFGYTMPPPEYLQSIIRWLQTMHQWSVQESWLTFIPGIVKGIAFAITHFTKPGDKIIIQPPVYHPFQAVPTLLNRQILPNPLQYRDGQYFMDLDGLRNIIDPDCKILILANPHNPIGITWDPQTLAQLAQICYERHILVISDEIHADMALFGHRHTPFATVSQQAEQNSITFMAPSKTFNIAGIVSSYAIIPNPDIRIPFYNYLSAGEWNDGTLFAYTATHAAYTHGHLWLRQMLRYIEQNILFLDNFLKQNAPHIRAVIPQASFLVWLDCRQMNLSQAELNRYFINKARLALNDGAMFGPQGEGFMRINIGCPRATLEEALRRMV